MALQNTAFGLDNLWWPPKAAFPSCAPKKDVFVCPEAVLGLTKPVLGRGSGRRRGADRAQRTLGPSVPTMSFGGPLEPRVPSNDSDRAPHRPLEV